MRTLARCLAPILLLELMGALLAYRPTSAAQAAPLFPDASAPAGTPADRFEGVVLIPKQTRFVHRVVHGWVYGPLDGRPLAQGDQVALLDPREHEFVRSRTAAGQLWVRLSELGWH